MDEQRFRDAVECNRDMVFRVFTAVMRLPERYRVPLVLHYYGGFSTEEIAKLLHVPGPTVRTRLARGRGRLRAMLEGDCYD